MLGRLRKAAISHQTNSRKRQRGRKRLPMLLFHYCFEDKRMAHFVRSSVEPKFIATDVELVGDLKPLKAYFSETPAHSETRVDASWFSGTWIPPELVPKTARITKGDALYDWQAMNNSAPLVSERVKACVEELDPGRHQFFPVDVLDKFGQPKSGPFYVFNVVGNIDSIIEERSNLKTTGKRQIRSWIYERKVGPWKCALNKNVIGNRAAWLEMHYGRSWFFSDKLVRSLKDRNIQGVDFDEYCEECAL